MDEQAIDARIKKLERQVVLLAQQLSVAQLALTLLHPRIVKYMPPATITVSTEELLNQRR